ncbi:unnamed protein product [Euphydryas editha]|uniref:Uncharacterized protein n=1 Tax=Euphydryas editha TaxID=104508 RepID=A0AAU9T779_EUPED|nr:unnamed protein product [Euphydryas editha]
MIAIAVLKTKPQNVSIDDHLNQLKSKINYQSDDDITICEDDFNIDDDDAVMDEGDGDSVTLLKDFDINHLGDTEKTNNNSLLNVMQTLGDIEDPENEVITNNSQSTYFDGSQDDLNEFISNFVNEDDNLTLSEQFIQNIDKENEQNASNNAIADTNKIDSQQTELYTLAFTEYNTHISQSQDNFVISKKLILNNKKNDLKAVNNVPENLIKDKEVTNKLTEKNKEFYKNDITNKSLDENNVKYKKTDLNTSFNHSNDTQYPITSDKNFENTTSDLSLNFDSLISNVHSQTSLTFDNLSDDQEKNGVINKNKSKDITESLGEFEYSQSLNFNTNSTINDFKSNLDLSQNRQHTKDTTPNIDNTKDAVNKIEFDKTNNANINFDNDNIQKHLNDNTSPEDTSDLTNSQAEIVTFKVLEELSKVKSYLHRKERISKSDSGYRSFQPRYSGDSVSQCPGLWINESAHCLMNFIIRSPMVISTSEITEEISKVLGKLIDNLHEDEIYPNFLEEILETIDKFLKNVHEGLNYGENILNKDELIQRIFLLNRSIHIIKYTIEKITMILEKTLENLTDAFEIQHTDKCENICYIFHILEDLLNRYNYYKTISSQSSSQMSQDDKILKKSSLTEIWRKKWNLSKVDVCEGSSEKKCVLTKCGDVLNRIIIQAMEGYSLMSFAALQCFNLLQN